MITSDAHEGIQYAISKVFPEAAWQRCQFHFSRNIINKAPKKYQAGLAGELQEMFNCKTIDEARKRKDAIIADYKDIAEEAMNCLDEGFESAMSVMVLPHYSKHQKAGTPSFSRNSRSRIVISVVHRLERSFVETLTSSTASNH